MTSPPAPIPQGNNFSKNWPRTCSSLEGDANGGRITTDVTHSIRSPEYLK